MAEKKQTGKKTKKMSKVDTDKMLQELMDEALEVVEGGSVDDESTGGLSEIEVVEEQPADSEELRRIEAERDEYKARSEDYYNKLLRIAADFDNFKKRSLQEKARIVETANENLFTELLPVLDNFERAIAHIKEDEGSSSALQGIEIIFNQLMDVMSRFGLKRFSALGESFDPQYHQAVAIKETNDAEPDTIVEEYAPGYMLNSKLLRPAMVVVAKPAPNEGDTSAAEDGGASSAE